jgi:(+)-pinoresinol hydroxylase
MKARQAALTITCLAWVAMTHAAEPVKTKTEAGHRVFIQWCAPCHSGSGFKAGIAGLQAKYQGAKPAVLEERTDLTPAIVKAFVRNGTGIMPPFRRTEVSDADLEAIAKYLAK